MNDKHHAIIEVPADQKGKGLLGILLSNGFTGVTITSDLRNHAALHGNNLVFATTTDDGKNGLEAADCVNRRYYYVFDYEINTVGNIFDLIDAGYANFYIGPIDQHPSVQGRLISQQPTHNTQQLDDELLQPVWDFANIECGIIEVVTKPSTSSFDNVIGLMISGDDENVEEDEQDGPTTVESNYLDKLLDVDSTDVLIDATENQGSTPGSNIHGNQVLDVNSQEASIETTANREPTTTGNDQNSESVVKERRSESEQTTIIVEGGFGVYSREAMMDLRTATIPGYTPPSITYNNSSVMNNNFIKKYLKPATTTPTANRSNQMKSLIGGRKGRTDVTNSEDFDAGPKTRGGFGGLSYIQDLGASSSKGFGAPRGFGFREAAQSVNETSVSPRNAGFGKPDSNAEQKTPERGFGGFGGRDAESKSKSTYIPLSWNDTFKPDSTPDLGFGALGFGGFSDLRGGFGGFGGHEAGFVGDRRGVFGGRDVEPKEKSTYIPPSDAVIDKVNSTSKKQSLTAKHAFGGCLVDFLGGISSRGFVAPSGFGSRGAVSRGKSSNIPSTDSMIDEANSTAQMKSITSLRGFGSSSIRGVGCSSRGFGASRAVGCRGAVSRGKSTNIPSSDRLSDKSNSTAQSLTSERGFGRNSSSDRCLGAGCSNRGFGAPCGFGCPRALSTGQRTGIPSSDTLSEANCTDKQTTRTTELGFGGGSRGFSTRGFGSRGAVSRGKNNYIPSPGALSDNSNCTAQSITSEWGFGGDFSEIEHLGGSTSGFGSPRGFGCRGATSRGNVKNTYFPSSRGKPVGSAKQRTRTTQRGRERSIVVARGGRGTIPSFGNPDGTAKQKTSTAETFDKLWKDPSSDGW